jgi:hypothetical protein
MATATDAAGAAGSDQENRVTLRDPIRESEGLFYFNSSADKFNKKKLKFFFRTS